MTNYNKSLEFQFKNAKSEPNKIYLIDLYKEIETRLVGKLKILELGAGAGISKLFIKNRNILRTDLLSTKGNSVKSGIDAHRLPFKNETFDAVISVDFLHHLENPQQALQEINRVLIKPNSKLVFIEPYVSIFSYPIYKIFHNEVTTLMITKKYIEQKKKNGPSYGNQIIGQKLFRGRKAESNLYNIFGPTYTKTLIYRDFLSFFATGGINRPMKTSPGLIKKLIEFERIIPNKLMKFLASRIVIEITI